jgi:hypothetical protein
MILKTFAVAFALIALGFFWLAHAGDNSDARALAGIFYIPAGIFGAIDVLLWIFALRP